MQIAFFPLAFVDSKVNFQLVVDSRKKGRTAAATYSKTKFQKAAKAAAVVVVVVVVVILAFPQPAV